MDQRFVLEMIHGALRLNGLNFGKASFADKNQVYYKHLDDVEEAHFVLKKNAEEVLCIECTLFPNFGSIVLDDLKGERKSFIYNRGVFTPKYHGTNRAH